MAIATVATGIDGEGVADRAALVLERVFGGDIPAMASCLKISRGRLRDVLKARATPAVLDQFLRGCRHYHGIDTRWVEDGIRADQRAELASSGLRDASQDPPDDDPACVDCPDPFVVLGRRIAAVIDEVYGGDITRAAGATGLAERDVSMLHDGSATPDDLQVLTFMAAVEGQVDEDWLLSGEGEMRPANPALVRSGPVPAAKDLVSSLSVTDCVVLSSDSPSPPTYVRPATPTSADVLAFLIDATRRIASAESADVALRRKLDDLETLASSISRRIDTQKDIVALARTQIDAHSAYLNQVQAGLADESLAIADRLDGLTGRLEALEARLKAHETGTALGASEAPGSLLGRLEALEKAERSRTRVRRTRPESWLDPDKILTVTSWANYEGEFRDALRPIRPRRAMSKVLNEMYAITRPDFPKSRFRVADLRLAAQWVLSAGDDLTTRSWMAYYRDIVARPSE